MPFDNSPAELPAIDDLDEEGHVLMRAAAIVAERWCQGELGDPGGVRCAIGAIIEAAGGDSTFASPSFIVHRAIMRLYHVVGRGVEGWNDAPSRKAAEVSAAMRAAARTTP